jgi:hypothetical protein
MKENYQSRFQTREMSNLGILICDLIEHKKVRNTEKNLYVCKEVKVKLSLCLTKHHAMKAYCGSGGEAPRILYLGTRWRSVVIFTLRPLHPRERAPRTHWIEGRVSPRAGLDTVVKRDIPSPCQESNP